MKRIKEIFLLFFSYFLSWFWFLKPSWNTHLNRKAVILIHGYFCSGTVWLYHGFLLKRKKICPVYTVNLGWPFAPIEYFAEKLGKKVSELDKKYKKIILVGHSMGGVVATYFALKDKQKRVRDIITIASPLKGTDVKIGFGKCFDQMQKDSPFIKELLRKIRSEKEINFYHIACKEDLLVDVNSSILEKKSENVKIFKDLGHSALLFSKKVNDKLVKWIEKI